MMSLDEKYYLYDNYKILTPQLGYKFIFSEIDNIKKENVVFEIKNEL